MRGLVVLLLCIAAAALVARGQPTPKKIHVVFMNHLDVGFDGISPEVGLAINVINRYFDVYFPLAITASNSFGMFGRSYTYTTHSWLVDLYLNCDNVKSLFPGDLHCPNATMLAQFNDAMKDDVFWWHAFPFNGEPEAFDTSLFRSGLATAKRLAQQFSKKPPITMSQRDVPGMTRAVIPTLRLAGIEAITVGVNEASAPPAVPSLFLWGESRDPANSIICIYHPGGYGGINVGDLMMIPGTGVGLMAAFKGDNQGPPFADEAMLWITVLSQEFPESDIEVSTFDNFVTDILQYRDKLPLVKEEIGDTWLQGVSTDPWKSQAFREVMRIRSDYCETTSSCPDAVTNPAKVDPEIVAFDRLLLKLGEHTWGLDIKLFLNDTTNWTNELFQRHLKDPNFQLVIKSWHEQRDYLGAAISSLSPKHPLALQITAALAALKNNPTSIGQDMVNVPNWKTTRFNTGRYNMSFGDEGGINYLFDIAKNRVIVDSPSMSLGQFIYTTFDADTYTNFLNTYSYCNYAHGGCGWFGLDFGKPNVSIANPVRKIWSNSVQYVKVGKQNSAAAEYNTFYVHLTPKDRTAVVNYGAPRAMGVFFNVSRAGDVRVDVYIHQKTPTRLPEATWFSFAPNPISGSTWIIPKLTERVDSAHIVVNGSSHNHIGTGALSYDMGGGSFFVVESLDAPLVSVGTPFPFPTPLNQPANQKAGVHFCIHNNIWGTNYPMWYPFDDSDAGTQRYRFMFSVQ